jgi:hypothetical protein
MPAVSCPRQSICTQLKCVYSGIMQDDKDDWKEAAATMAMTYEQAHLTIAATWASDSDCGLFASDREPYKARKLQDHELYIHTDGPVFPPPAAVGWTEFPLLSRAWVYQERLLSSRMVHFGKDQVSHRRSLLLEICIFQIPKHS